MAKGIDNNNVELEHYGTWVRKDLKDVDAVTESVSIEEDSLDDLNFDDVSESEEFDEPFSLDDDEMEDDFDLPDLDDLGDDLISPEEESELISMAEDNWSPDEDEEAIQPLDDEEMENSLFLDNEDIEAASDFMPEHDLEPGAASGSEPALPNSAMLLVEKQTELLGKIEKELSVIRDEILDIRKQINISPSVVSTANEKTDESSGGGFFEEDDDESIVLTGDELDNIFNTAEMTVEDGSDDEIQTEDPGLSMLSEADELSFDTEELSLDTEELSLDTEELSLDTEELSLDTEELSLDTEELSLDTEELSLDTEELSP